jgi:hypothetical protein
LDAFNMRHEQDYQTVIDVIDLSQRAILVTGFFDGRRTFIGNRYATGNRLTAPDDEIVIDIYRITLVRP